MTIKNGIGYNKKIELLAVTKNNIISDDKK